jgi:hypothetical protein
MVKLSFVSVLMTPSHFVLNSSRDKIRPSSSLFSVRNKKKSAGARSGEWGEGVGKQLDLFFGQELLNFLGGVNWIVHATVNSGKIHKKRLEKAHANDIYRVAAVI